MVGRRTARRGLIFGLLVGAAIPAMASTADNSAEMRQYIRARLADSEGKPDAAANGYARLLQASPDDKRLALRAYRQALTAGNYKLAVTAARQLDRQGALTADGSLMLLSDAIVAGDWTRATLVTDRVAREDVFTFIVPVIRGWIALGKGSADPLAAIGNAKPSQMATAYARDHRILIGMAKDQPKAFEDLRAMVASGENHSLRLQLAGAALLARNGDRAGATALLQGRAPELAIARDIVQAGKIPDGALDTPALGLSELFAQLAIDVKGDGRSPLSLLLARQANFLAPSNVTATIATADLLANNDYRDSALALLAQIPANTPLAESARQERSQILLAKGDKQAALVEAKKAAARGDADVSDFIDLGNILTDLDRSSEAATAFQKAIDMDTAAGQPRWPHMFLKAGALDRAGDWSGAKALLKQAVAIDPRQPIVLNYLGYGMLEHNENLDEAQGYIERASALDPQDPAIADSLGWVYYKQGNYPGAIAALERAVAGEPGQSVMHEHLGDAYWVAGRRIEARYAWRAALIQADEEGTKRLNSRLADGLGSGAALSAK